MLRFLLVLLTPFTAAVGFALSKPALTYYVRNTLLASGLEVSLLTTGYFLARSLSAVSTGFLGDRTGRRGLLAPAALLAMSLSFYLLTLSRSWFEVVLLRVVQGFAAGTAWPSLQTLSMELAPSGWRARGVASYYALGTLGMSLGYALFGSMRADYKTFFLYASLLYLAASLLSAPLALHRSQPTGRGASWSIDVRLDLFVVLLMFSSFSMGFMGGIMQEFSFMFLREVFGLSEGQVSWIYMVGSLSGAAGGLLAAYIADRAGEERVLVAALPAMALGSAYLGAGSLPILAALSALVVVSLLRGLRGIPRSMAKARLGGYVGTGVGAVNTFSDIGSIVSPPLAGYLYDTLPGSGLPYLASSLLLLVAAVSWIPFVRRPSGSR